MSEIIKVGRLCQMTVKEGKEIIKGAADQIQHLPEEEAAKFIRAAQKVNRILLKRGIK